jgi:hypothetical protein
MSTSAKSPLILAGCGCASLLAALILLAAAFFLSGSHGTSSDRGTSPDDLVGWRNTRDGRTGPLAEHYVDFEFRYPKAWSLKPIENGGPNFVTVERAVDGKTHENFNVGYFATAGSKEGNQALYAQLIAQLQNQFAQQFRELKKVHEGATKVGSYDAWEGLFTSTAGDGDKRVSVYMRVILLPTPDATKGVTLVLMGTSLSPDLESADDLGRKGDLPAVLESFKFSGLNEDPNTSVRSRPTRSMRRRRPMTATSNSVSTATSTRSCIRPADGSALFRAPRGGEHA